MGVYYCLIEFGDRSSPELRGLDCGDDAELPWAVLEVVEDRQDVEQIVVFRNGDEHAVPTSDTLSAIRRNLAPPPGTVSVLLAGAPVHRT